MHLQRLYDDLTAVPRKREGFIDKFFSPKVGVIKGLYFWGGVGRGKTYLVDTFFTSLPIQKKLRTHFYHFMRRVHSELQMLKGEKNPLKIIGKRFAQEAQVICFDEFFVSDITDAMILGALLDELFMQGVCLVATSNIAPDDLYKEGLQRARFLPAIKLLNDYTEVVNVDGGTDYRLRVLKQARLYHTPLTKEVEAELLCSFDSLLLGCHDAKYNQIIDINGREITATRLCNDVAWFEFSELCDGPRSQNDYIEIAQRFQAIILANVMQITSSSEDIARRFISLVDEFYDRNVKLVISADVGLQDLYVGEKLTFEFQRTLSRLLEMQSYEFLERTHKIEN
ncbi:UNVERIFIED_CONTAM: hypothetical protein GTU68_056366 [Idotea baltica]|nr:hypothetical protein [Idotea baltica]